MAAQTLRDLLVVGRPEKGKDCLPRGRESGVGRASKLVLLLLLRAGWAKQRRGEKRESDQCRAAASYTWPS